MLREYLRDDKRFHQLLESKLETAKNLAEMGFAVEAIAKATGLSCEEIEKL